MEDCHMAILHFLLYLRHRAYNRLLEYEIQAVFVDSRIREIFLI